MSGSELLIVLLAALILFGGKRLPELARTWGKTVREIRQMIFKMKREMGLDFDLNEPLDRPQNFSARGNPDNIAIRNPATSSVDQSENLPNKEDAVNSTLNDSPNDSKKQS